jgi:hypothetical protein
MELDTAVAAAGVRLLGPLCIKFAAKRAQAWVPARARHSCGRTGKAGPLAGIDDDAEARDSINDTYQYEHTIPLIRSNVDLTELAIPACVVA